MSDTHAVKRNHRSWNKKRFNHRDTNHPRWCLSTILVPESGFEDRAVRLIACRREHGHLNAHRGPARTAWTDAEAHAMDELWKAHNRWIGGRLVVLGHQKRQPGFRR